MTPATLMVRLTPGVSNDTLLRLTADLAGRLKATTVIGIAACQPMVFYGGPDMYIPQDVIDQDQALMEQQLKQAQDGFRQALHGRAETLEWRSTITVGMLADYIAEQMRAADLLITGLDEGGSMFDTSRRVGIADLVMRAGRPVLVVGAGVDRLDLRSVVVGWKESREARRALEDALPLLQLAERVTVVEIAAEEDLPAARARIADVVAWLKRHGVTATPRAEAAKGDDAGRLAAIAGELGAGLLVGGAYGHARVREWILGGVTRDVLLRPARCSLVSH